MDIRTSPVDADVGNNTIHLCIVTETFPPEVNGVAMTLQQWTHGLRDRGHTVSIVRPRQNRDDSSSKNDARWLTIVNSLPLPGYEGLHLGLPSARRLQKVWRESRPNIVYIATEGPLGRSALKVARRLKIPALSGFHTNFHTYSRHYRFGWLHGVILNNLRRFHNRTAGTLVPTTDMASQLRNAGFEQLHILGRGVDGELFNPERRDPQLRKNWKVGDGEIAILYVGRLAAEKNLQLVIDSFEAIQKTNARTKLILVGDGPLMGELVRKQYKNIVLCGMKHGEELAKHYASCDVFLFPSETETFGNVVTEAMASGLAIVAFNYAAARMHIIEKASGCLIPPGEQARFTQVSVALLQDATKIQRLGTAAREAAKELYWRNIVIRLEEVLLKTIAANQNHQTD